MTELKVVDLRKKAKELGINKYYKLKKKELINEISLSEDSRKSKDDFSTSKQLKGKIIGEISGCFCPPDKADFDAIVFMIKDLHLDYLILITFNRKKIVSSRHGVPLEETLKIWRNWGKLIARKYGTKLLISDGSMDLKFVPSNIKKLYIVRIKEGMTNEEFKTWIQERKKPSSYSEFFPRVPKDKINEIYCLREPDSLSVINFVKCLQSHEDCLEFTPDEESEEENKKYIKHLRDKYGRDLKA